MNTLLKVMIVGFFLMLSQPLCSDNKGEGYGFKSAENKYERHLKNTVWVVPPSTLLAYKYSSSSQVPVSDQTVWVINEVNQGYFFGDSYTTLNSNPSSHKRIVGSITPQGAVNISFSPTDNVQDSDDIIEGVGRFEKRKGQYVFIMQMNSDPSNLTGLSHWSYMISVKPKNYFYQHLPGVDISVPEFISLFSPG